MKTRSYAQKINESKARLMKDTKLSKEKSLAVFEKKCSRCEHHQKFVAKNEDGRVENVQYCGICNGAQIEGYMLCRLLSSFSENVWVRITPDRRKLSSGDVYKNTIVGYLKYKDNYNHDYWECLRDNKIVVLRADVILGGTAIYKIGKSNYRKGGLYNPDGTRHVFATEHYSKQGRAIETVETIMITNTESDDFGETFHYEARRPCPCGGTMRYDDHGEAQCDRCEGTTILK